MNKLKISIITLGLVVAGVASAALVETYVTSNGTAAVEQSVVFGNNDTTKTYTFSSIAGDTHTQSYNLKNRSSVSNAPVEFVTSVVGIDSDGKSITINDGDGDANAIVGITVEYFVDNVSTPITSVTLSPGTHTFDTVITFDVALNPAVYQITTQVNPVIA